MKKVTLVFFWVSILFYGAAFASPAQNKNSVDSTNLATLDSDIGTIPLDNHANYQNTKTLPFINRFDTNQTPAAKSLQQHNNDILLLLTIAIMLVITFLVFGYISRIKTLIPSETKKPVQRRVSPIWKTLLFTSTREPRQYSYELITNSLQIIAKATQERKIKFSVYICPSIPPFIHIDRRNLERKITNLLRMAIKVNENGNISLKIKPVINSSSRKLLDIAVYNEIIDPCDAISDEAVKNKQNIEQPANIFTTQNNNIIFRTEIPVTFSRKRFPLQAKTIYLFNTGDNQPIEQLKSHVKRGFTISYLSDQDTLIRSLKADENSYQTPSVMVVHRAGQNKESINLVNKLKQNDIISTSMILVCTSDITEQDEHMFSSIGYGAILKPGYRVHETDNAIMITDSINRIKVNSLKSTSPLVLETIDTFTYSRPVTKPGKYQNTPILDEEEIKQQNAYLPQGHITKLVELFVKHNDEIIVDLVNSAEKGNLAITEKKAHKLKGSAASIHTPRLFHICKEIEYLAASKKRDELVMILTELKETYTTTVKELEAYALENMTGEKKDGLDPSMLPNNL